MSKTTPSMIYIAPCGNGKKVAIQNHENVYINQG